MAPSAVSCRAGLSPPTRPPTARRQCWAPQGLHSSGLHSVRRVRAHGGPEVAKSNPGTRGGMGQDNPGREHRRQPPWQGAVTHHPGESSYVHGTGHLGHTRGFSRGPSQCRSTGTGRPVPGLKGQQEQCLGNEPCSEEVHTTPASVRLEGGEGIHKSPLTRKDVDTGSGGGEEPRTGTRRPFHSPALLPTTHSIPLICPTNLTNLQSTRLQHQAEDFKPIKDWLNRNLS